MHSILEILEEPTGSSSDLISLEDLKLALGIEGSTDDAALEAAIAFQSRIITEYLNRRLAFATALETFTFDRNEELLPREALTLSLYPIVEIFEISSTGATPSEFEFDSSSGRLWSPDGSWTNPVAVTYSGGYLLPDECPARLQLALTQTVNQNRTSGTRDQTIREVQHGDTRIAYFTSQLSSASSGYLSASVVDLIKPYRRLYVA